jgi:hypothetical protein
LRIARHRRSGWRASRCEADFGRFEAARRGALDRVGEADGAQFPAPACVGAALLEAFGIGELEGASSCLVSQ